MQTPLLGSRLPAAYSLSLSGGLPGRGLFRLLIELLPVSSGLTARVQTGSMRINSADASAMPAVKKHPAVMQPRVDRLNWPFVFDTRQRCYSPRVRRLTFIEKPAGRCMGKYRNYRLIW